MAPSKIAKGIAATGPDDKLVAVDANATTSEMVLSKATTTASKVGSDIADSAKKQALNPKSLAGAIKVENGKFGLDSKSMKSMLTKGLTTGSRIGSAGGNGLSNIPGIGKDTAAIANKYLKDIVGDDAAGMLSKTGEIYKIGKGIDTDTASGLMKGIGRLTGHSAFTDIIDDNAYLATGLAYLDKAIELGIPDAIDVLMKKLKDDKRKRQRLLSNIRGVVMRGDLDTIELIFEYVGPAAVLDEVPEACTYILAGYSIPVGTPTKKYPELKSKLLRVLTKLDPNWDKAKRGTVYVNKLEPFAKISRGSKTLLQLEDTWDVPIAMARTIRKIDLYGRLKKDYPLMVTL